jgi:hypothetical protein
MERAEGGPVKRPEVGPFPNMGNPIRPNPLSPEYNLNMPPNLEKKAEGGRVGYMVGERGPELFMPDQSGAVIPNHELRRLARKYGGRVSNMRAR